MEAKKIVSRDPATMGGEMVFTGSRVPARALVDYLVAGRDLEEFLDDFPTIPREQAVGYLTLSVEAVDAERDIQQQIEHATRGGGQSADGRRHRLLGDLGEEELSSLGGRQRITPSEKGSGSSDVSRDHDHYLAEG